MQTVWRLPVLWRDERGAVHAAMYLLLLTLVALGALVGLATYRDQVVQELGDLATALNHLDQSVGTFQDTDAGSLQDPAGQPSACITVCLTPTAEDDPLPLPPP